MRLHVNNRTLGLVSDLNDHDVLKHQVMKHANHANNQISERSIPEEVQIKDERSTSEVIKVKKFVQIRMTAGLGFEQKKMSDSTLKSNSYNCIRFKIEH